MMALPTHVSRFSLFFLLGALTLQCALLLDLKADLAGVTFFAVGLQSLFMLFILSPGGVSLLSVYSVFSFVFLSVAPWIQYSNDVLFWTGVPLSVESYVLTNAVIFLANLSVIIAYLIAYGTARQFTFLHEGRQLRRPRVTKGLLLLMSSAAMVVVFYLNDFSITKMLLRGAYGDALDMSAPVAPAELILGMLGRLVPLFCLLYALAFLGSARLLQVVLFLLVVIAVFPTGVARYLVGFVYIPILLMSFRTMRRGWWFPVTLIAALVIIFPFLNQFRYFAGLDNVFFGIDLEFFKEGHFDAYQNFARVVDAEFVTYGYQLLGVLLFFVPRAVWPSKPVGSGFELSRQEDFWFHNISMPFLGEGYANFGVVGSVGFATILAIAMGVFDKRFAFVIGSSSLRHFHLVLYLFVCGAFFFFLRGDMLSSFAYITAGFVAAFAVKWACTLCNARLRTMKVRRAPQATS